MPYRFKVSLLFIVALFATKLMGQNLYLNCIGESPTSTQVIEALNPKKTFKDLKAINTTITELLGALQTKGYFTSQLNALTKQNDSTYKAQFTVGQQIPFIHIYYKDVKRLPNINTIADKIFDDYFIVKTNHLEATLQTLNNELAKQGDPFLSLSLSQIELKDQNTLKSLLAIQTFKKRTIDSIVVAGYKKFPKSYLKHFLKIKAHQTFNLAQVNKKTELLNNLNFARKIKTPEVLFTNDSTILYLYIEKQKSNAFDGFLGFGTNTKTNKLQFNGYLNLNLINNLNFGESFNLLYKSDESEQRTFNINVATPYLFKLPIGAELSLKLFKKDSSFSNASQAVKLVYPLSATNSLSAGIQSTTSENLLNNSPINISDYASTFYTLNYSHKKLQPRDPLFPVNFSLIAQSGFGNRTSSGLKTAQSKYQLTAYKIFNLSNAHSLFLQLEGAYLNSDKYYENELFRFGGINSIRGFKEQALVASGFGVFNTEYRYRLNPTLYVNTIFDTAYYEDHLNQQNGRLYGIGFGMGLLTNTGLFKLQYSLGKQDNQPFLFSNSKIHISLNAWF